MTEIESLYNSKAPFAVGIGVLEFMWTAIDYYLILPPDRNELVIRFKRFHSVTTHDMDKESISWFVKNKELFRLAHEDPNGKVLEPTYIDFKKHQRRLQTTLWNG